MIVSVRIWYKNGGETAFIYFLNWLKLKREREKKPRW